MPSAFVLVRFFRLQWTHNLVTLRVVNEGWDIRHLVRASVSETEALKDRLGSASADQSSSRAKTHLDNRVAENGIAAYEKGVVAQVVTACADDDDFEGTVRLQVVCNRVPVARGDRWHDGCDLGVCGDQTDQCHAQDYSSAERP